MRKNEFINEIRGALRGYPHNEVENSIEFYSEIIEDRMENGMSEEEAVASLGDLDRISLAEEPEDEIPDRDIQQAETDNGKAHNGTG